MQSRTCVGQPSVLGVKVTETGTYRSIPSTSGRLKSESIVGEEPVRSRGQFTQRDRSRSRHDDTDHRRQTVNGPMTGFTGGGFMASSAAACLRPDLRSARTRSRSLVPPPGGPSARSGSRTAFTMSRRRPPPCPNPRRSPCWRSAWPVLGVVTGGSVRRVRAVASCGAGAGRRMPRRFDQVRRSFILRNTKRGWIAPASFCVSRPVVRWARRGVAVSTCAPAREANGSRVRLQAPERNQPHHRYGKSYGVLNPKRTSQR